MTNVDVFVLAGQSNARGKGTSSGSPDVASGNAYEWKDSTTGLVDLDDPVGVDNFPNQQANTGSAWPAFAKEYYAQTSRKAVYVTYANGGSGQHPDTYDEVGGDNGWGEGTPNGTLDDNAQARLQDALNWLNNNGYNPTTWGVVWLQGERDADWIDDSKITKSQYKTAFKDHIDRWKTEFGSDFRFFIIQIGHLDSGDTKGFQDVRAAQSEVANARSDVDMVSTLQKDFPEQGKMQDNYHYTQTGYNDAGTEAGTNTASVVLNNTGSSDAPIALTTQGGVLQTSSGVLQLDIDNTAPTISNFSASLDTGTPTISNFTVS